MTAPPPSAGIGDNNDNAAAASAAATDTSCSFTNEKIQKEDAPKAPPRKKVVVAEEATTTAEATATAPSTTVAPTAPPRRKKGKNTKKELPSQAKTISIFDSFNALMGIIPFLKSRDDHPTTNTPVGPAISNTTETATATDISASGNVETTAPPLTVTGRTNTTTTVNASTDNLKTGGKPFHLRRSSSRLLSGSRRDRISRLLYISVVFLFLIFIFNATYVSVSVGLMAHMAKSPTFMNEILTIEQFKLSGWNNEEDSSAVRPKCTVKINFKNRFFLNAFRLDLSNTKIKLSFPHAMDNLDVYTWMPLMETQIDKVQFGGFDFNPTSKPANHIDLSFYLDFNTNFPLSHLITYVKEMKDKGKPVIAYVDIDFEVSTRSYLVPITKIQIANNKVPLELLKPAPPLHPSSGAVLAAKKGSASASPLEEMRTLIRTITDSVELIKFHDDASLFGCRSVIRVAPTLPSFLEVEVPPIYLDGSFGNAQSGFGTFGTMQLHGCTLREGQTSITVDVFSTGSVHTSGAKSLLSSIRDGDFEGKFLKLQATPSMSLQTFFDADGRNCKESQTTMSALQTWFKEKIAVSFDMSSLLGASVSGSGSVSDSSMTTMKTPQAAEKGPSLLAEIASLDDEYERKAMNVMVMGVTPEGSLQTRFTIRKEFIESVFQCHIPPTLFSGFPSLKLSANVSKNFVFSNYGTSNVDLELRHVYDAGGAGGSKFDNGDIVFDLFTTVIDLRPMIELSLKSTVPGSSSMFREALSLYSGYSLSPNKDYSLLCRYLSVFSVYVTSISEDNSSMYVCYSQNSKKNLLASSAVDDVVDDEFLSSAAASESSEISSVTEKATESTAAAKKDVNVNHFVNMELVSREALFSFNIDALFSRSSLSDKLPYVEVEWNQISFELYHMDFVENLDVKMFSFVVEKGGLSYALSENLSPSVSVFNGRISAELSLINDDPSGSGYNGIGSGIIDAMRYYMPTPRPSSHSPSIIRVWKSFLHHWYQTDRLPQMQMRIGSPANTNEQRFTFTIPPRLFVDPKKTSVSQIVSKVLRTQVSFAGFHENALALFFELPNLSHFLGVTDGLSGAGAGAGAGGDLGSSTGITKSKDAKMHFSLSLPSIKLNGCAYPKNRMECFSSIGIKPCKIRLSVVGDRFSDVSIQQNVLFERIHVAAAGAGAAGGPSSVLERNRLPLTLEILNLGGLLKIAERLLEVKESQYSKMRSGLGWTGTPSSQGGNRSFLDRFINSVGEGIILDLDMTPRKDELKAKAKSSKAAVKAKKSLIRAMNKKVPASLNFKLDSTTPTDFKGKLSLRIPEALLPTVMNSMASSGSRSNRAGGIHSYGHGHGHGHGHCVDEIIRSETLESKEDLQDYPKVMSFKWGKTKFSFKFGGGSFLVIKLSKGEAMVRLDGLPEQVGSSNPNSCPISPEIKLDFHLHIDDRSAGLSGQDFHTRTGRQFIDEINAHFSSPSVATGRWLKRLLKKSVKFEISMLPYDGNLEGFEDKTHKMKTKIPFHLIFKAMKIASKVTEKNPRDPSNMDFSVLMKPTGLPSLSSVEIPCFIPHLCPISAANVFGDSNAGGFGGGGARSTSLQAGRSTVNTTSKCNNKDFMGASISVSNFFQPMVDNVTAGIGGLLKLLELKEHPKYIQVNVEVPEIRLNAIINEMDAIGVTVAPMDIRRKAKLLYSPHDVQKANRLNRKSCPLTISDDIELISVTMSLPDSLKRVGTLLKPLELNNLFLKDPMVPKYSPMKALPGGNGIPDAEAPVPLNYSPLNYGFSTERCSQTTLFSTIVTLLIPHSVDQPIPIHHIKPVPVVADGGKSSSSSPPSSAKKEEAGKIEIIRTTKDELHLLLRNCHLDKILPPFLAVKLDKGARLIIAYKGREYVHVDFGNIRLLPGMNVIDLPISLSTRGFNLPSHAPFDDPLIEIALFSEFLTCMILRKRDFDFTFILQVTSSYRTFIDFSFEKSDHLLRHIEQAILRPIYTANLANFGGWTKSIIDKLNYFTSVGNQFVANKESDIRSYIDESDTDRRRKQQQQEEDDDDEGISLLRRGGTRVPIEGKFFADVSESSSKRHSIPIISESFDEFNENYASTFTFKYALPFNLENPFKKSTLSADFTFYGLKGVVRVAGVDVFVSSCLREKDRMAGLNDFLRKTHSNPAAQIPFGASKDISVMVGAFISAGGSLSRLSKIFTQTGKASINIDPLLLSFGLKAPGISGSSDEAFQVDYLLQSGNINIALLDDVGNRKSGETGHLAMIPHGEEDHSPKRLDEISLMTNQIFMVDLKEKAFVLQFETVDRIYLKILYENWEVEVTYFDSLNKMNVVKNVITSATDKVMVRLDPVSNEVSVDFLDQSLLVKDSSRFSVPFEEFSTLPPMKLNTFLSVENLSIRKILPDLKNSQLFHLNFNSNYVDERSIMLLRLKDSYGHPLSLINPLPEVALVPIDDSYMLSTTITKAQVRYVDGQNVYEICYSLPRAGRYEIRIKISGEWQSLPFESVYCRHSW